MKQTLLVICCFLLLHPVYAQEPVMFENHDILYKQGSADINVNFPTALGESVVADSINSLIFSTFGHYVELKDRVVPNSPKTLEVMLLDNANRARQLGKTRSIEAIPYVHYSAYNIFGNNQIISIFMLQSFYSGGAHGMSDGVFINVDPNTGASVDLKAMVIDTALLLDAAADLFCKERRLPKGALQLQTGLFVELQKLPMPRELGLSDKGLVLYYQPYEIAPYSTGAVKITIPYSMMKEAVSGDFGKSYYVKNGYKTYDKIYNKNKRDEDKAPKHHKRSR